MAEKSTEKKLARSVNYKGVWYKAGESVPDDIAAQINPKAFAVDDETGQVAKRGPDGGTSSGARLAARVSVGGTWYGPDTPVPDDVARLITNPKVWEGGQVPDLPHADTSAADGDGAAGGAAAGAAKPAGSDSDAGGGADTGADTGRARRAGRR
jgi:hypothetical protein